MAKTVPAAAGEESSGPPERVVARLRRNARPLLWPALLLIAVAGAVGFFAGNLPEPWQEVGLYAGAIALVVFGCVLPFFAWLSRRYTITTRRIILRHGLFVRVRQELLHSRGYDLTVRRSWLQTLFGSGDVRINTGLDKPVVLRDVPNPALVQSVMHDLMEQSQSVVAAHRQQHQAAVESASPWGDETVAWGGR